MAAQDTTLVENLRRCLTDAEDEVSGQAGKVLPDTHLLAIFENPILKATLAEWSCCFSHARRSCLCCAPSGVEQHILPHSRRQLKALTQIRFLGEDRVGAASMVGERGIGKHDLGRVCPNRPFSFLGNKVTGPKSPFLGGTRYGPRLALGFLRRGVCGGGWVSHCLAVAAGCGRRDRVAMLPRVAMRHRIPSAWRGSSSARAAAQATEGCGEER